jgi:hypothetical protein
MRCALNTVGGGQAEVNSCRRKRRFRTLRLARREMRRVFDLFATCMGYYRCRFCGGYHLYTLKRVPRRRRELND